MLRPNQNMNADQIAAHELLARDHRAGNASQHSDQTHAQPEVLPVRSLRWNDVVGLL